MGWGWGWGWGLGLGLDGGRQHHACAFDLNRVCGELRRGTRLYTVVVRLGVGKG